MAYKPVNWEDSPSASTPITADNLNIMDEGISDVDKRTTELETELPKKIKNENNVIGTNHILDGAITQAKIAEDLLKLILAGGGSGSGITYEQVKVLMETKEDTTNKVTFFDALFNEYDKFPTVMAVINYLKEYYYDYEEIDGMLADLGGEGLTTTQINALDAMFKKCAFTSNATAEYEAFKTAFGISDETTEPDTPVVPDEPDTPTEPDEPTQFTDYSVLTGYYIQNDGSFKAGGYNTAYFEVKAGETYTSTAFNGKTAPQFFLVESGYAGQTTQQTAIEYVNEYPDSLSMHTITYTVPQDGCLLIPYLAESGITIVKE